MWLLERVTRVNVARCKHSCPNACQSASTDRDFRFLRVLNIWIDYCQHCSLLLDGTGPTECGQTFRRLLIKSRRRENSSYRGATLVRRVHRENVVNRRDRKTF